MLELSDLFPIFLLALVGYYWWCTKGIKEAALRAARSYCEKMDVQLLDESIVLRNMRPRLGQRHLVELQRRYQFEFTTTGEQRYLGEILLVGNRISRINLDPHRL